MEMLTNHLVVEIVALCLIVGYIIKKWVKDVDNKWIPTIVTALGIVAAIVTNLDGITLNVIVGGAVSGLASTGLHQMFKQWIDNGGK